MSELWRFTRAEFPDDPALNYALDHAIAEHVEQEKAPATVRLWQPGRCLAIARFDHRLPRFGEAVQFIKKQGIEIVQRESGGKAVWQNEGYLNFSIITRKRSPKISIPETYARFSEGLMLGLCALSIKTEFKHIEGAFCDGPYDLATNDRKLVGTAQVQKRGFIIVHGTILVDCDLDEMVKKVCEFYERAGQPTPLRKEAMTTVISEMRRSLSMEQVIGALFEGYQQSLGRLQEEELLSSEWERVRRLRSEIAI